MSRPTTVLGVSLKLYLDVAASIAWAEHVALIATRHPAVRDGSVRLFALPSLPALPGVRAALLGTPVLLGAQDLFTEDRGAYTGGVSGSDLRAVGCSLVEVGHVERRQHFGEGDDVVRGKLAAAFRNELVPVLCVGDRHDQGSDNAVAECSAQLVSAFTGLSAAPAGSGPASLIVAYEPEWAIGQDQPADPAQIEQVSDGIRETLGRYPWLASVDVIYGGGAQPGLLSRLGPGVDGLFLGRFAHEPEALEQILDEVVPVC